MFAVPYDSCMCVLLTGILHVLPELCVALATSITAAGLLLLLLLLACCHQLLPLLAVS